MECAPLLSYVCPILVTYACIYTVWLVIPYLLPATIIVCMSGQEVGDSMCIHCAAVYTKWVRPVEKYASNLAISWPITFNCVYSQRCELVVHSWRRPAWPKYAISCYWLADSAHQDLFTKLEYMHWSAFAGLECHPAYYHAYRHMLLMKFISTSTIYTPHAHCTHII